MQKKWWIVIAVFGAVFAIAGGCFWYVSFLKKQPSAEVSAVPKNISQEDVVALTKPGVVRIVERVKGHAVVPNFNISLKTLSFTPMSESPNKLDVPFDTYIEGSGFVVNSDGYIMTNSHVVSRQTIKEVVAAQVMALVANAAVQEISRNPKDVSPEVLEKYKDQESLKKIVKGMGDQARDYIATNSQFTIDKNIVVLDPKSPQEELKDLFQSGFPAKMISVNDDFSKDDKDVALIKIDQTNLPTLKIGTSDGLTQGNKVSIFGFPASAEFNQKNLLESTLTQGVLSAIKDSQKKDFKIFQTDAKVSHGSSGGPMVNDKGEVVGLVTFQADNSDRQEGDNFAFALPASVLIASAQQFALPDANMPSSINTSSYPRHYLAGLSYKEQRHCKDAVDEFELAAKSNNSFGTRTYVQSHIDQCKAMMAEGRSVDTRWDEKKEAFSSMPTSTRWFIAGGVFAVIVLIVIIVVLLKKMRKEEDAMHHLEERITNEEATHQSDSSQPIVPAKPLPINFNVYPPAPPPRTDKMDTFSVEANPVAVVSPQSSDDASTNSIILTK